ncbi:MAG: PAS domain S-box protein [Methylococcales bacterium]|nr:PAS domain S-box protein [Methylococcaceae bacterium]
MPQDAIHKRLSSSDNQSAILVVVLIYAVFAALWILLSDKLIELNFKEPEQIILISMFKGWLFVGITSLMLYTLMRRWIGTKPAANTAPIAVRRLGVPFILMALFIIGLTTAGILNAFIHHKQTEVARLNAIAEFKSLQIGDWLNDRQAIADFLQTSGLFVRQYREWLQSGDMHQAEPLWTQIEPLLKNQCVTAVTFLDSQGKPQWHSPYAPPELSTSVLAAAKNQTVNQSIQRIGPYQDAAGHFRLDLVIPLTAVSDVPPQVVLHVDLAHWFLPILHLWPVPTTSGESIIYRREGNKIVFFSDFRNTLQIQKTSTTNQTTLADQLLNEEAAKQQSIEGLDYKGVPVLAVAWPIPNGDWMLLVKLDKSELYGKVSWDIAWIGFTGLLTLVMTAIGFNLLRQSQQLALSKAVEKTQAENLRDLILLNAIAHSSDDAIFAKDLEGRYVLFNQAASQFVGKPAEDVIGQDDRAIFPEHQAEALMATGRQVIAENRLQSMEEILTTASGERVFLATKGPLRTPDGQVIGLFGISRDITDRKHAENQLELWARPFEFANFGLSVIDAVTNNFMAVNPTYAREHGYSQEELIGKPISMVYPPELYEDITAKLTKLVTTTHCTFETEHVAKNGRRFPVLMDITLIKDADGKPLNRVAYAQDITKKKQSEVALKASEQRFRQLFALIPIPLAINNQDGRILAINDRFVDTFGYTQEDCPTVSQWSVLSYPDPDYRQKQMDQWERALKRALSQESDVKPQECQITCKSGQVLTVIVSGIIIADSVMVMLSDITERRAIEDALRSRERYQRALLDNFPFMVWLKDTESRLLAANQAYAQVANVADPEDLIGKTDLDFWDAELAEQYRADDRAVLESGKSKSVEEEITQAGRRFWIETYKSPVILDGNVIGTVGFARDISIRKSAENELLRRNQEIERFNSAMIGRELDMIALKQRVNELSQQLGLPPPYPLSFIGESNQSLNGKAE